MQRLPRNQLLCAELLADYGRLHAYEIKTLLVNGPPSGSVYQALSGLLKKGYVTAEWELPSPDPDARGGPPRKYFELTALGHQALASERAAELAERRARLRRAPRTDTG